MAIITIIASELNKNNGDVTIENDQYGSYPPTPYLSMLVPALKKEGYEVEVLAWNDDKVNWDEKECLLMGPAWDYSDDIKKFKSFLNKLTKVKGIVINPADALNWIFDKSYLKKLQANGVDVAQTILIKNENDINQLEILNMPGEFLAIKGLKDNGGVTFKKN